MFSRTQAPRWPDLSADTSQDACGGHLLLGCAHLHPPPPPWCVNHAVAMRGCSSTSRRMHVSYDLMQMLPFSGTMSESFHPNLRKMTFIHSDRRNGFKNGLSSPWNTEEHAHDGDLSINHQLFWLLKAFFMYSFKCSLLLTENLITSMQPFGFRQK